MTLMPIAGLDELAVLLGLRTWHPNDRADVELLAALLSRRLSLAEKCAKAANGDPYARLLG